MLMLAFGAPSLLLTFESDLTTILHTGGFAILLFLTTIYWRSDAGDQVRIDLREIVSDRQKSMPRP